MTAPARVVAAADEATSAPAMTAVVPTHERPELMRRAVQSIIDQDYAGHIEILVVFDACEPLLPALALPSHRSLTALTNTRTRGLAGARNTGILAAAHELVAFLDDDDVWMPTKLTEQIAVFADNPGVLLVGTAMQIDDGRTIRRRLVASGPVSHDQLLHDRLAGLHSSSFVFRRGALTGQVGLVDEDLPGSYGEDYDLLLRTAERAPVLLVNRPLVTVTWQGQSLFFGKWAQYAEALQYLLNQHPEFERSKPAIARISSQIAFALAASGDARGARRWAVISLRARPSTVKSYLAIAISLRLVSADRVGRLAARLGRGI